MEIANGRSKLDELETAITKYQDGLFRFAFYRTGCFADSQDIVQDVFIKLYRENNSVEMVKNMKHYLYKCIGNACIDYRRKNKRRKTEPIESFALVKETDEKDVSQRLVQLEEFQRLEKLLSGLPEEQAETIRLRCFDDLSFVEIAQLLETPETTVKSRFKYGIEKLKAKISTLKSIKDGLYSM
jgi:RNA polymerase sigma-70 factor, ECF subfamily